VAQLDQLKIMDTANGSPILPKMNRGWVIPPSKHGFFLKNSNEIILDNQTDIRQVQLIYWGRLWVSPKAKQEKYRREVEYMDGEIGHLLSELRRLKLRDKTALVVAGDHGEGLGEYHNPSGDPHFGHVHYLNNVYMKIPLLLSIPGFRPNAKEESAFVTLLDIAPTLTGFMGLKTLPHFQGRNLLKLRTAQVSPIYQQTWRPEADGDKFGRLDYPWHLILTPLSQKIECFDLRSDPDEKADLSEGSNLPAEVERMKQDLRVYVRKTLKNKGDFRLDKKTMEMLRSLGYLQ